MDKFLRDWRQDALNKAQYDSAVFIGDKLLAITSRKLPLDQRPAFLLTVSVQTTIRTPFG